MAQLKSWFQKAVTSFLDPDREGRVATLVNVISQGLQAHGNRFSLEAILTGARYTTEDLTEAKNRVFQSALERGWNDGVLTAAEQATAKWLAARLEIPIEVSRELECAQARKHFGLALAQAMQDGVLDQTEEVRLRTIAAAVGCEAPTFARQFFQYEGAAFLRSIFLACVADNHLSQQDWSYLIHVTAVFGVAHAEMLSVIRPQAQ